MEGPISLNDQWKPYAEHLLKEFEWSIENCDHALNLLEDHLMLFPDKDSVPVFIKNLIQAVSLTAAPMMALQNFDRYLTSLKHPAQELMRCIQDEEHINFLTSLFATSTFFTDVIASHPEFLDHVMKKGILHREKQLQTCIDELEEFTSDQNDFESKRNALCCWKRREYLRIGIRDLLEEGDIQEYCRELTNIAEAVCLFAYRECAEKLVTEYGLPKGETLASGSEGEVRFCVIAMGKFGGHELNFSSDIDLNFVYGEEGETKGSLSSEGRIRNRVSNQEFYCQLAFAISGYINEPTSEGMIFRVDTRLRPEGSAGQIARSYNSYSSFFFSQALMWEKVAYVKARVVAGSEALGMRFEKLSRSFAFTHNDPDILLPEVARLKKRIDFERLSAEGRQLDIKRGRGGIREIEFITACMQLLLAPVHPELRTRSTIEALEILGQHGHLKKDEVEMLIESYWFFRRVEHQIQMVDEKQTHELPDNAIEMQRLAIRLGFLQKESLVSALNLYRENVRAKFETVFRMDQGEQKMELIDVIENREAPDHLAFDFLKPYRMDSPEGLRVLRELALGTREMALLAKGQKAFRHLLPILMGELKTAADPINAVKHLAHLLKAHRSISAVYEMIVSHPPVMRLLIRSLGFSPMLARLLTAYPEWLDEVFESDVLSVNREIPVFTTRKKDREDIFRALRKYRQRETVFLAIREVIGMETSRHAAARSTVLADRCLSSVMELCVHEELRPHIGIVGMGTMGGCKVHPFGDLDIAFITDADQNDYQKGTELEKCAQKILKEMSAHTPEGQLWDVDCRLRPDGASSPLVTTLQRVESYYQKNAGFWEFQSAIKLRPSCGNLEYGKRLIEIIQNIFLNRKDTWNIKKEIREMRRRMEAVHKCPRHAKVDLKGCPGGIIDIDFLVQYIVLSNFDSQPDLWIPSTTDILKEIEEKEFLPAGEITFIQQHHYNLRLIQRTIRFYMETSRDLLPVKETAYNALVVAMQAQTDEPQKVLDNIARDMITMREIFDKHLGG